MKVLTLQITADNFDLILAGKQKVETRLILPNTAKRYIEDFTDEDEELKLKEYDALYLINGRRKDARRLTVEVVAAELFIMTDEEGNDIMFEHDAQAYLSMQVHYQLGKILSTENIP